ncbi:MAG: hypothetical protein EPN22_03905 [Nitrospirae bacterium]|nr:MAG: hypothetical protein EPN22_03905 [Nitrospirota bacterium]
MSIAENVADKLMKDHHILIEASLCSRFRTPKSDCSLCADACPANAISVSGGSAEINERCIDCGVCYSACPNGAFSPMERTDEKIMKEISFPHSSALRISCERGDAAADIILPCLSRLTEALFLETMLREAPAIEIAKPLCENCPLVKAAFHLNTIILRTQHLCDMLGIDRNRISIIEIPLQSQAKPPEKSVSRREFFSAFRAKATKIAAAAVPDIESNDDDKQEAFRNVIRDRRENRKRSALIKSIVELGAKAKVNQTCVSSENAMTADIAVGTGCTACGVCASLCPTGAISKQWTEQAFSLSFSPDLCTNCRICEKTCMHKALNIKETVSLNLLLEQKKTLLFEAERKTCISCRMAFIGEELNVCPLCLDRNKKQTVAFQELFK